ESPDLAAIFETMSGRVVAAVDNEMLGVTRVPDNGTGIGISTLALGIGRTRDFPSFLARFVVQGDHPFSVRVQEGKVEPIPKHERRSMDAMINVVLAVALLDVACPDFLAG